MRSYVSSKQNRRFLQTNLIWIITRFHRTRSQIRSRAGIRVSSGHLPIGSSPVFNLVHPLGPLHDHRLLRRPFILQLPSSLLLLQPTPQPSIQDHYRDVLPLRRLLPLHRPARSLCDHFRHVLYDRGIWAFEVHFLVFRSPGWSGFGHFQGERITIRHRREDSHGSDLVDDTDRFFRSRHGIRFYQRVLDSRQSLLYRRKEASHRFIHPKAEVRLANSVRLFVPFPIVSFSLPSLYPPSPFDVGTDSVTFWVGTGNWKASLSRL